MTHRDVPREVPGEVIRDNPRIEATDEDAIREVWAELRPAGNGRGDR